MKKLIAFISLILLAPLAWASVPVKNAWTNVVTSVCAPNDINPNCGSSASGTLGPGTVNQEAVFSTSTKVVSGSITDLNGNVGIGTTVPNGIFQVIGGGNVGIGSLSPGQALDVQGTVRVSGQLLATGLPVISMIGSGAKCDDSTDDTAVFNAILTKLANGTGGTVIADGQNLCKIAGQVGIPWNASSFTQPTIRITGTGGGIYWNGAITTKGSGFDMTYNASLGKFTTYGYGRLILDNVGFFDTSNDSAPFFFDGYTVIETGTGVTISGTTPAVANTSSAKNDAFIFGYAGTPGSGGTSTTPFNGYGTSIKNVYFDNIRKIAVLGTYANAITIENNTVSQTCGNLTGGAIDITGYAGSGSEDTANIIENNLVEITNYEYLVNLTQYTRSNIVSNNSLYDQNGTTTAVESISPTSYTEYQSRGLDAGLADCAGSCNTPVNFSYINMPSFYAPSTIGFSNGLFQNVGIGTSAVVPSVAMYVKTGNVGIGTIGPQGALDVGTGKICLNHTCNSTWPAATGGGASSNVQYLSGSSLTGSNSFVFDGTNVGIGSLNPMNRLSVEGGNIVLNGENNLSANVGIGTANPQSMLDIVTNQQAPFTALRLEAYDGSIPGLYSGMVGTNQGFFGTAYYYSANDYRTPDTKASEIIFPDAGGIKLTADTGLTANSNYLPTARITITSGGNVGIGTGISSPASSLTIGGKCLGLTGELYLDTSGKVSVCTSGTFPACSTQVDC